jgi:hypothetical protein
MFVSAAALAVSAALANAAPDWDFSYRKFTGEYVIYAGQLGETAPPTPGDRKLSMMVMGDLARDMFHSMGPDIKGTCGTEDGGRVRRKQKVSCTYFPADGYSCHIGINLRTGESIPGSIC